MEMFCYFLNFQPLALAFIDGSCLNPLFWRLPSGGFSIPMILIKGRGWLSVPRCLPFLRGGGRHPKGTGVVLGKGVLIFSQQLRTEMIVLTLYPTRKSRVVKDFQRTARSLSCPSQHTLPAWSCGGFGGSRGSEGSPLLGTGLHKKAGHSIIECVLPDLWHCAGLLFLLCWSILADGGQKADLCQPFCVNLLMPPHCF